MSELSNAAKSLLADYGAHADALAGDGQSGWSAIARRIDRGDEPIVLHDPPRTGPRRAMVGVAIAIGLAAAVVVAWLGTGTMLVRSDEQSRDAAVYGGADEAPGGAAAIREDAVPAKPTPRPARPVVIAPPSDDSPVVLPPEPPAPRRASEKRSPRASTSDDLEEVRTIASARAALRDGEPGTALRILRALAREHPKSAYAEEREVLTVAALCAADRTEEARTAADRFRRVHPRSPLVAHLAHGCGAP